jgi:hypothetical protein
MERLVRESCSDYVLYDVKVFLNNGSVPIQIVAPGTEVQLDEDHTASLKMDTRKALDLLVNKYGIPYNSPYCLPNGEYDYHRALWTVEDGCGNLSTCEYLFRLEDCKKPTPVCINGLSTVVMPSSGEITIWAVDFNASSFDDCTPAAALDFSFLGSQPAPSAKFACDCDETVPDYQGQPCYGIAQNQSHVFEIEIWVADHGNDRNCDGNISWSEQNKDFCSTFIVVDDNEGVCDNTGSAAIAGEVHTEELEAVENVQVSIQSTNSEYPDYITAETGAYSFYGLTTAEDYNLSAQRNDDPMNGISTLDLVRIQEHLLGINEFTSPYKRIAADANNSQSISVLDIVELRKLILGIYLELPNNQSWRFVDAAYEFSNNEFPWPFGEEIEYQLLSSNQMYSDFIGIKVGDVNNTVAANALTIQERGARKVLQLIVEDQEILAGHDYQVAFSADNFKEILGYQFTMQTPGLVFKSVNSGIIDISAENIAEFKGMITMSWNDVMSISARSEDVLFTMQFTATQNGTLSEMLTINSKLTMAEGYRAVIHEDNSRDAEILDISLVFGNQEVARELMPFALYQNEPNPWSDETVIGFDLPEKMDVNLTIYNGAGKILFVKKVSGNYGYNRVILTKDELHMPSIVYYRVDAGKYTATKKMIMIE